VRRSNPILLPQRHPAKVRPRQGPSGAIAVAVGEMARKIPLRSMAAAANCEAKWQSSGEFLPRNIGLTGQRNCGDLGKTSWRVGSAVAALALFPIRSCTVNLLRISNRCPSELQRVGHRKESSRECARTDAEYAHTYPEYVPTDPECARTESVRVIILKKIRNEDCGSRKQAAQEIESDFHHNFDGRESQFPVGSSVEEVVGCAC
jgi:hypothetical protein